MQMFVFCLLKMFQCQHQTFRVTQCFSKQRQIIQEQMMTDEKCLLGFLEGLKPLHTIFGLANHELKNVLLFALCMLIHTTFIAREREQSCFGRLFVPSRVGMGYGFPTGWGWGMGSQQDGDGVWVLNRVGMGYGFPTGWGWGMGSQQGGDGVWVPNMVGMGYGFPTGWGWGMGSLQGGDGVWVPSRVGMGSHQGGDGVDESCGLSTGQQTKQRLLTAQSSQPCLVWWPVQRPQQCST